MRASSRGKSICTSAHALFSFRSGRVGYFRSPTHYKLCTAIKKRNRTQKTKIRMPFFSVRRRQLVTACFIVFSFRFLSPNLRPNVLFDRNWFPALNSELRCAFIHPTRVACPRPAPLSTPRRLRCDQFGVTFIILCFIEWKIHNEICTIKLDRSGAFCALPC